MACEVMARAKSGAIAGNGIIGGQEGSVVLEAGQERPVTRQPIPHHETGTAHRRGGQNWPKHGPYPETNQGLAPVSSGNSECVLPVCLDERARVIPEVGPFSRLTLPEISQGHGVPGTHVPTEGSAERQLHPKEITVVQ